LAVEAYAYVHLLERYRRTWSALKYMCKVAALLLGTRGIRVLDVGSGPGPSVYAV
jgi:ribosomal protein RSM22 (predicted rRNA methylase)